MGSGGSATSRYEDFYDVYRQPSGSGAVASSSRHIHTNSRHRGMMADIKQLALHEGYDSDEEYDEVEEEDRFVNLALLSHIAVRLRDKVPRGTHVKGGIPYSRAFTGKDIVVGFLAPSSRPSSKNCFISQVDHPSSDSTRASQHACLLV